MISLLSYTSKERTGRGNGHFVIISKAETTDSRRIRDIQCFHSSIKISI